MEKLHDFGTILTDDSLLEESNIWIVGIPGKKMRKPMGKNVIYTWEFPKMKTSSPNKWKKDKGPRYIIV